MIGALRRHSSASAIAAGLVAVLVAYTGPLAIVVQAARAAGLPDATLSSWIWAFSVGSGVTGIALSAWFRAPVVVAWSTPGAALLVTALPLYTFPQAVGAYVLAAALMVLVGATGLFARAMDRIPPGIVAAMLAGILFKFAAAAVTSIAAWPGLVLPMIAAFFGARRLAPRHAVAVTLAVGAAIVWASGRLEAAAALRPALAVPVLTWPELSGRALVGLGLPLFLVTLTSQNATGLAVLRGAGYDLPASPLVTVTGIASLLLAPFGCHGVNLAAITAAICTGPEAHPDPRRRWVAGVACGAFYLVVGAFGATVALAFGALPDPLIATVGGLALLAAMTAGLTAATREERTREGAMATFVVTASGVSFFGIGAAFWGLVAGAAVHAVATWRGRRVEAARLPAETGTETGSRGG